MHKQRLTNFKVKKKQLQKEQNDIIRIALRLKKILKHELHLTNTSTSNGL